MSVLGSITRLPAYVAGLRHRVTRNGIELSDDARRRVPRLTIGDGVPLHPALTDAPSATLTLAPIFDVAGLITRSEIVGGAGLWMSITGAGAAVPTAAAGTMDYLRARSGTEVQRLGLRHALLNTTALGLTIASLVARRFKARPTVLSTMLSTGSGALVTYSAHLGGIMVYRDGMRVVAMGSPEVSGEQPAGETTGEQAAETSGVQAATTAGSGTTPAADLPEGSPVADPATVMMAEAPDETLVTAGPDDVEAGPVPDAEGWEMADTLVMGDPDEAETGPVPGSSAGEGKKDPRAESGGDPEQDQMEDGEAPGSAGKQPGREDESTEAA